MIKKAPKKASPTRTTANTLKKSSTKPAKASRKTAPTEHPIKRAHRHVVHHARKLNKPVKRSPYTLIMTILLSIIVFVVAWPYVYSAMTNLFFNDQYVPIAGAASGPTEAQKQIPASATVLTLTGLNYNVNDYIKDQFDGVFTKAPYTRVKVDYPASLNVKSIATGVANLDAMLKATKGPKIVLAHSQGAQVASRWMREHANDPKAPSAKDLTFILTGNPLRSNGNGYLIGRFEVGNTKGQPTPTDTPWTIIDVARRYDGWADYPTDKNNSWAIKDADAGKRTFHSNYKSVNLNDPTLTISKKGNTTYVLTQEKTLPIWSGQWWIPDYVVSSMRATIEKGYKRPTNDPRTTLLKTPAWDVTWITKMQDWGISYTLQ